MKIKLLLSLLASLAISGTIRADEEVSWSELPDAVQEAFLSFGSKSDIEEIEMENEGGLVFYEAEIEGSDGEKDVKVLQDGSLIEIEEEISSNQLPEAVREFLKNNNAGDDVEAESVTVVLFEIEIDDQEILIDASGKVWDIEDEHDEDDDHDDDD